jgi:hypothetical protein
MRSMLVISLVMFGCARPKSPAPAGSPRAAAPGTCWIRGAGAASFEYTDRDPVVDATYWLDEEERARRELETLASGFADLVTIVVTCRGDQQLTFSILGGRDTNPHTLPFAPKRYTGPDVGGVITASARIRGAEWTAATGTIEISAFDATRMAGTIELTGTLAGGGELELTGAFDGKNPHHPRPRDDEDSDRER